MTCDICGSAIGPDGNCVFDKRHTTYPKPEPSRLEIAAMLMAGDRDYAPFEFYISIADALIKQNRETK